MPEGMPSSFPVRADPPLGGGLKVGVGSGESFPYRNFTSDRFDNIDATW